MTTSLITGGAGFIGSHLAELLLSRGDKVVIIDDLSTGSLKNVSHLEHNSNFRVIVDSVLNRHAVDRLVERSDRVFHLAAAVGVDLILKQPARVIETNIIGTDTVLQASARCRVPLLVASSSEVYGKSDRVPFREDADLLLGPTSKSRWSYACSKAIDEFMALAYNAAHGLPVVISRFFNTTGPRQNGQYGMVVPRFVEQAIAGQPITVYGSGEQSRSFTHVTDVVSAVVDLLETSSAYGEVVNLGGQEPVTLNRLAARVKELADSSSDIVHVPFEQAYSDGFEDIFTRQPDISKACSLIGFAPRYELGDIIKDVITWKRESTSA